METRKVQITGGSTYTLSLPKAWAERNGIGKGDPLFVQEENDSLTVSASGSGDTGRIELDGGASDALQRRIIASYVKGYGEMLVNCAGEEKEVAKEVVNKLMGTEIVEEGSSYLLVEDLLDPFQLDSSQGLKRMHLMSRSMHRDAVEAFGDEELARDVERRDDEVDRLYLLIARQFSLLQGEGVEDHFEALMCARGIERIADHASKIAGNAAACDASGWAREDLQELSEATMGLVENAVSSFHERNQEKANRVFEERKELEELESGLKKGILDEPTEVAIRENTILDSLSRSADYATDVAEASINSSLR